MTDVNRLPVLVSLHHVGFQFANGETLLEDLNLSIDHTPTGIVGRNGMGKSVLARLLAGVLLPSSGVIKSSARIAYIPQTIALLPGQTVAQVSGCAPILAALERLAKGQALPEDLELIDDRWDLAERLRQALDSAGLPEIDPNHPAEQLSGGQLARVALIGALLCAPQLLILDEPTNHLDSASRDWLLATLGAWRGALVVVSHDRHLLNTLGRIIELSPLGARLYGGNYDDYRVQRDAEQHAAQAALEQARLDRRREHQRLKKDLDSFQRHAASARKHAETANVDAFTKSRWKGAANEIVSHVRSAHVQHKQALNERVRSAHERVIDETPTFLALPGMPLPAGRQVATLVDTQLPWLDPHAPSTLINASLCGPVRVAVNGPNGCGKSTLLKLLAGQWQPISGECTVHVPCAYLDQQLSLLDDRQSIVEQLRLMDTPLAEAELRTRLALLHLDALRVTQPIGQLSGGERLKAAMAVALWRKIPAQLLLLDEPTNHLDLESVLAFEQALQGFAGALIAVSHDAAFLKALKPTHVLTWAASGWQLEVN
ncbi:peptide ABC transporter ATP-binding protein [Pseudomonas brenneri]|uniref:ABC-F family ATP-binding cassette domain-containing protein n=1 Tax=Pseudomonas brenneri TaxID=129817 RepID=A0A5B2UKL9_9PSED|nr:ABC-F family ATP-binding cassette domain-containing protein [Pseudomonas brenneri]KAA2226998.1 ABC-F family ATP-binding cassette domain-containing protein [Pseudomonas brenneri]TWR82358.1 ABC-F family ATP-binding cassette domain-containing protein [Pseudomonas brenneri]GGL26746.1 peptide ABC transporter ATP-binding protein [Pseudomonas brenneri]SDU91712.1 ATPase components of ABC transporters with duplicated ATPase domains [Pseudomonas brenneri]